MRGVAQLGEPFAESALGEELRDEQRDLVRLGGRRLRQLDDGLVDRSGVGVHALHRVLTAGGDDPVDHAEVLEHLLAAGLDALAA